MRGGEGVSFVVGASDPRQHALAIRELVPMRREWGSDYAVTIVVLVLGRTGERAPGGGRARGERVVRGRHGEGQGRDEGKEGEEMPRGVRE